MRESVLTGFHKPGFGSEPNRPKAEAEFTTRGQ